MDQFRISELTMGLSHRHGDRWARMEPSPAHDAAEGDPERQWARGRIYSCTECDEQIRVDADREEGERG